MIAGGGAAVSTVRIVSDSRPMDGAMTALVEAAQVCLPVRRWLIVGGHMVNLHVLHSGVDKALRATHDADLAVSRRTISQGDLLQRLRERGYHTPTFPNRFERHMDDIGLSIDLVVPSGSTKHQPNIDIDDRNFDGMPLVDEALDRDPVILDVVAVLTDSSELKATVRIPDLVSAIAMKTFAVAERSNPHDAFDLGMLLHAARASGLESDRWPKGKAFAAAKVQLSAQFDRPGTALELATDSESGRVRLRDIASLLAQT
jgi:predicted nucleotidyltransferase